MRSKPVVGKQVDKLYSIPGKVPNPINMPDYCYFKDRCELCCEKCSGSYPGVIKLSPTHEVSCYRYADRPEAGWLMGEHLGKEGASNGKKGVPVRDSMTAAGRECKGPHISRRHR